MSPLASDVAACRQRQPKIIVRAMRAHAAARRRMPPVLDVAFDELSTRTKGDLFAQQPRFGVHQRHGVLQLVAESVGSARLVEAAARPQAARDRLVHQPAVGQHVERRHRACRSARPSACVASARSPPSSASCGGCGSAEALHQLAGRIGVACRAEPKDDLALLSIREVERDLHRGTGIQRGAGLAGKAHAMHRRWVAQRAVAAEEFGAVEPVTVRVGSSTSKKATQSANSLL